MYISKSVCIILPSGREYFYSVGQNDVESILLFSNNITINFNEKGPIVWVVGNLAGFSHDKELHEIVKPQETPTPVIKGTLIEVVEAVENEVKVDQ